MDARLVANSAQTVTKLHFYRICRLFFAQILECFHGFHEQGQDFIEGQRYSFIT